MTSSAASANRAGTQHGALIYSNRSVIMAEYRDIEGYLRRPALVFFSVTLVLQFADLLATISPFAPARLMWRFNALGSTASSIGNFLLILLLLFAVSILFRATAGLALVALVAGIVALVCFVGAGIFMLDTLQLQGKVDPQVAKGFVLASSQALWRLLVNGLIAVLFTTSSSRAWRAAVRESRRDPAGDDRLVMRAPSVARAP